MQRSGEPERDRPEGFGGRCCAAAGAHPPDRVRRRRGEPRRRDRRRAADRAVLRSFDDHLGEHDRDLLLALSLGYTFGGRLADRRADLRGLCLIVLAAAVLLALVPFAANPFLHASVSALGALSVGGFLGSLAAVLVLVAVPVPAAWHGRAP